MLSAELKAFYASRPPGRLCPGGARAQRQAHGDHQIRHLESQCGGVVLPWRAPPDRQRRRRAAVAPMVKALLQQEADIEFFPAQR